MNERIHRKVPGQGETNMLDVREAVDKSYHYLRDLLDSTELSEVSPSDVTLEELEKSEDGKAWAVTFSYPIADAKVRETANVSGGTFPNPFRSGPRRKFKLLKIDADNGQLISMKVP